MRVYAPFIYFVERHPTYLERVRAILKLIDDGVVQGFSSTVTLTEVLAQPIKVGNVQLQKDYRDILVRSRSFMLVPVDVPIAERAADLRARYNLKTPDALQISVAIHMQCDAFLTNDLDIRRVKEVQILALDELEV